MPARAQIAIPNALHQMFRVGKEKLSSDFKDKPQKLAYPTKGPRPYAVLDWLTEQWPKCWPTVKYNQNNMT